MQKDIGFPRNCIDDKYFELKVQKTTLFMHAIMIFLESVVKIYTLLSIF